MTPWVGSGAWPRVYRGYGDLSGSGLSIFADQLGNAGAFGSYAGQPDEMHHIARVMKSCLVCIAKELMRGCENIVK